MTNNNTTITITYSDDRLRTLEKIVAENRITYSSVDSNLFTKTDD